MFRLRDITCRLAAALAISAATVAGASAFPREQPREPRLVVKAAASCYAVGQRVAAQKGGQLMQASLETRGGRAVCRIVIRIPGRDGQRPRRAEIVVPAN